MASINRNKSLSKWLSSYSNLKPFQSAVNISLILLGPLLAIATYLFLGPFNVAGQSVWLRFFLLLDLVYVLLIVGIVLVRILYVLSQRRSRLAGSKLHFRLAGVFTTMSLLPTITVAVFVGGIFWVWLPIFGINEVPSANTIIGGFFLFVSIFYYSLVMRWNKRYIALN